MCIFPIMYSEINILMLNVNFVQDSRCFCIMGNMILQATELGIASSIVSRGYETFENRDGSIFPIS